MSDTPSLRSVIDVAMRLAGASESMKDEAVTFPASVDQLIDLVRRDMTRAFEFSEKGLVCEAVSVIEDFPNLVAEADTLRKLPTMTTQIKEHWTSMTSASRRLADMPTEDELNRLAGIQLRGDELARLIEPYREAVLRGLPLRVRIRLVKKIRLGDPYNQVWLDQRETLEKARLNEIAALLDRPPERDPLEEALDDLTKQEWVATVPRTLVERLHEHVRPLRAFEASARYGDIAARVHKAAAAMNREELLKLEAEWAIVSHETGRMPSPDLEAEVKAAFDWLHRLAEDDRDTAAWESRVRDFEAFLASDPSLAEIDSKWAEFEAEGTPLPEELVARINERRRRVATRTLQRRLLIGAGTLVTLVAVTLGVVWFVQAQARRADRGARTQQLAHLLEKGRPSLNEAHELAEALRPLQPGERELDGYLDREAKLWAARENDRRSIAQAIAEVDRYLKTRSADAKDPLKLGSLKSSLSYPATLAKDYGFSEEATALAERTVELSGLLEELNATIQEMLGKLKERVANFDRTTPPIGQWGNESLCRPESLNAYIRSVDNLVGEVNEAKAAMESLPGADEDLKRLLTHLAEHRDTAEKQLVEVRATITALSPEAFADAAESESGFIKHVKDLLESHRTTLDRMSRRAGLEHSLVYAPWWESIETWRLTAGPRVKHLISGVGAQGETDVALLEVAKTIDGFLGAYPGTPYEDGLGQLRIATLNSAALGAPNPRQLQVSMIEFLVYPLRAVPLVRLSETFAMKAFNETQYHFDQLDDLRSNPYAFVDASGAPVLIEVSGETYQLASVKVLDTDDAEIKVVRVGQSFALELDEVPVINFDGRFFYRRSGDDSRAEDLYHLSIPEREHLSRLAPKRVSIHPWLKVNPLPAVSKLRPCTAIAALLAASQALTKADSDHAVITILNLIDELSGRDKSDPILRFQIVRLLVNDLIKKRATPQAITELLVDWMRTASKEHAPAFDEACDWTFVVHQQDQATTNAIRRAAQGALGLLPDLRKLVNETEAAQQDRLKRLRPFKPAGVLLPTDDDNGKRQMMPVRPLKRVHALVRNGDRSRFVELPVDKDGIVTTNKEPLPEGPVLVFESD
jgi:ABC-type transporter Mla subunit MlaD